MYRIDWYLPRRVLYARYPATITPQIIESVSQVIRYHLDRGNAPVHLIADARAVKNAPLNMMGGSQRSLNGSHSHLSMGWMVALTNNPMLKFMGSLAPSIANPGRYRIFSRPDEAIKYLQWQDKTVNWTLASPNIMG